MQTMKRYLTIGVVLSFSLASSFAAAGVIAPGLEKKLASAEPGEELRVLVTLADQVDIGYLKGKNGKPNRGRLIRALKSKSNTSQKNIKAFLKQNNAKKIQSFWIFNGLAVTADAKAISKLAKLDGIESIRPDVTFSLTEPYMDNISQPEWNINTVHAPELWSLGYTGSGTVVATMDTGVDAGHPDLASQWRGGDNSWFDPNGEHAAPYDANGHGTMVMGVLAGGDAGGSSIGIAPGAQWIAVKIFNDAKTASYSGIHAGFQWLLDPDGNPDTDDAPDVVNNSWGFPEALDQCFTEFQPDIQALKASGIGVVFSAGNRGTYGYNSSESPANYPESFAVGAVDQTLDIAYFSARGPSACDGGIYPEVVAPGVSIYTADLGDYYATVAGTSFAAPHVAGAMSLLLSVDPSLTIDTIESALKESAQDLGEIGPDYDYGYGLIDVLGAYNLLSQYEPQCTDADLDGFYAEADCGTLQDCNDNAPGVYPEAQEIKHDGIDQDCNGYDLTIDITKVDYSAKRDNLSVDATSALAGAAQLELAGYGAMKWNRKKGIWSISLRNAGGDPGTVTVSGIEGAESALTGTSGEDPPANDNPGAGNGGKKGKKK